IRPPDRDIGSTPCSPSWDRRPRRRPVSGPVPKTRTPPARSKRDERASDVSSQAGRPSSRSVPAADHRAPTLPLGPRPGNRSVERPAGRRNPGNKKPGAQAGRFLKDTTFVLNRSGQVKRDVLDSGGGGDAHYTGRPSAANGIGIDRATEPGGTR